METFMTPTQWSRRTLPVPRLPLPARQPGVLSRAALLAALLLLLLLPAAFAADPAAAVPQLSAGLAAGSLVIVGGGSPLPDTVRDRFLELAGGKNARLVVIPTASNKADQPQLLKTPQYWKAQNVASVVVLHTHSREQANDTAFVKPLTEATGVWLTGGVQSRLIDTYRGTLVERELRKLLDRGGVIAGTSAGAAVMSPVMIVGGNPHAVVGSGFGFLSGVIVDQHFQNRHRLNRLLEVLAKFPQYPGLGIDERTAIVVTGHTVTVMGNGEVRACLSAVAQQAASVKVLKPGERFDLLELCRSALSHVSPAPGNGKPTVPGMGVGRAAASP
jgi:cyanophycinase